MVEFLRNQLRKNYNVVSNSAEMCVFWCLTKNTRNFNFFQKKIRVEMCLAKMEASVLLRNPEEVRRTTATAEIDSTAIFANSISCVTCILVKMAHV